MGWLDEWLGAVGRWVKDNPQMAVALWIVAVVLFALPWRAHAQVNIEVCASSPDGACYHPWSATIPAGDGNPGPVAGTGVDRIGSVTAINADGSKTTLIMNLNAHREVPPGWTLSGNDAIPPSDGGPVQKSYGLIGIGGTYTTGFPSLHAVTDKYCADIVASGSLNLCQYVSDNGSQVTVCERVAGNGACGTGTINGSVTSTCPSGYGVSGTECTLTDASQVKKPSNGTCEVIRVGNVFQNDSRDPDCDPSSPTSSVSKDSVGGLGSNAVTFGAAGNGGTVTANGDGSANVSLSYPVTGGNTGTSNIDVGSPSGTTDGKVTGVANGTQAGQGTKAGSGSGDGTESCGLPGQPECNTRIDEAGTMDTGGAAAGDSLKSQYDAEKSAADAAGASGDASHFGLPKYTAPTGDPSAPPFSFLSGSDSCTNPTATYRGVTFDLPVCTVILPMKEILAWFLAVMTGFYAWARFTGRIGKGV